MKTAEAVTQWHVDKIADQISDFIVDRCIEQDKHSRVAVETMVGHNVITLTGEITTKADIDYEKYVIYVLDKLDLLDLRKPFPKVNVHITKQSPDISQGVNKGGAGDQGIMTGYACRDNKAKIPQELYLVRELLKPFKTDGKSQISIIDGYLDNIVLSVQGKTEKELNDYISNFLERKDTGKIIFPMNWYCNNTGAFEIGGWDADTGLTGRKIVQDQYGPNVPVGGGAFSGKDPTKVDRSGAYMARWIALQEIKKGANEVLVKLAYVIGRAEPVMQVAIIDGKEVKIKYDCRPQVIIERFDLLRPIYYDTARYGHFGINSYSWEKI